MRHTALNIHVGDGAGRRVMDAHSHGKGGTCITRRRHAAKQKGWTIVGQLITTASVCCLPVPYLHRLDVLTTKFWVFLKA